MEGYISCCEPSRNSSSSLDDIITLVLLDVPSPLLSINSSSFLASKVNLAFPFVFIPIS